MLADLEVAGSIPALELFFFTPFFSVSFFSPFFFSPFFFLHARSATSMLKHFSSYMVFVIALCIFLPKALLHSNNTKMASFSYHLIPASLPTRKAPELQKVVARQSKD